MTIHRLPDWDPRLRAYLRDIARIPFLTGRHDCATFAAGAVEAMTGHDLMRGYRGYRTAAEGLKKLQAKGYADQAEFLTERFEECPAPMAQVGDVVLLDQDALGIVQGAHIYAIGAAGLGTVPLTEARRAFRVPSEPRSDG